MANPKTKTSKSKANRQVPATGFVYITAAFNNTLITVTDINGNVLVRSSSGAVGFKGAKRSTPYASSQAALSASKKAADMGVKEVSIIIKGAGNGRVSSIKSIRAGGLNVKSITDDTPIPHNGCRPKKRRRT